MKLTVLEMLSISFAFMAVFYFPSKYWVGTLRSNALFMSKLHAIIAVILFILSVIIK